MPLGLARTVRDIAELRPPGRGTVPVLPFCTLRSSNTCNDQDTKDDQKVQFPRFDVPRSVHCNIVLQYNQQDAPVSQISYSCKTLYKVEFYFVPASSR